MYSTILTAILVFLLELRSALAAPTGNANAQVVLGTSEDASSKVQGTVKTVALAFESQSSNEDVIIEMPLGKRVPLRGLPEVPRHPSRGRILASYTTQSGSEGTYRKQQDTATDRTLCMAFPKPLNQFEDRMLWGRSKEYAAKTPSGRALLQRSRDKGPVAPVWWKVSDGWVDFESNNGRSWLHGLEIEALQCA